MQKEPQRQVETLFHAARDRAAGPERDAYLDGACGNDAELRSRVDALLLADEKASDFMVEQAVPGTRDVAGSSIGPYKLLQEIGEGGMGVVYMAEQERPVRRKVALKVIKLGMDTKQVIARFEAERQALAMMDHAHIARVLDAGSTEAGRPYFVMELVRGVPINEYCDTHKLTTSARLGLFVDVCRAVQHAHQKGIIHRDLKPTNVLVTSHDGVPVPKIIDFGVAKATNQRLTERTLFTEFHQVIGTPEYMSPEQAEMSGLDVDTRSDIYALGVLMYQLLTGTTPVDPQDLRTAGFEEMTRMIREDEPQAPSTRISRLGEAGQRIAKNRASDTGSLSRDLRGDLDWIVMKALEKDRTRRYDTASAFADDVLRHLEDRPVEAGPPGAAYRLTKFTRRNRTAVIGALVLAAVVGLGLAGTTAGFLKARTEGARSALIGDSLQDVLAMTDAGRGATRAEIEDVLATVQDLFGDDHATYAAVLDTLALRLHDAGDFEAAADLGQQSLEVWRKVYGEEHPNVAIALARLGAALRAKGDDIEAEAALRRSLEMLDGASDAPGLAAYGTRLALAELLENRGEYAEANELLGESLAILRASPTPSHFKIIETLERRLALELNQPSGDGRDTCREIYEETHAFYPDDSPLIALSALGLGRQLALHGEPEAAEPILREAITRYRASASPPPMYLFGACDALFQVLRSRVDPASVAEADDLLRDMIQLGAGFLGVEHTADLQVYYASRLHDRGRIADALEAVLAGHRSLVEADRPVEDREGARDSMTVLSFKIAQQPELDSELYAQARAAIETALSEEPTHAAMLVTRAATLYRQGEFVLAAETLDRMERPLSSSPGTLARKMSPADHAFRALVHAQLGHGDIARDELETLLEIIRARSGDAELPRLVLEVQALVESMPPSDEGD